jgi:hypothetical protein
MRYSIRIDQTVMQFRLELAEYNPFTQSGFGTYTTRNIPEPSGILGFCIALGIGGAVSKRHS